MKRTPAWVAPLFLIAMLAGCVQVVRPVHRIP